MCLFRDTVLSTLKRIVLHGRSKTRSDCSIEFQLFWPHRDKIVCRGIVLFEGSIVIILNTMYQDMLRAIHYCRLGADRCLKKAKEILFWPSMSAYVKDFMSECSIRNQFLSKQCSSNRKFFNFAPSDICRLIFLLIQLVDM